MHFCFSAVEIKDVNREIDSSDPSKAIQQNGISNKNKANRDVSSEFLMHNFNEGIFTSRFPDILK